MDKEMMRAPRLPDAMPTEVLADGILWWSEKDQAWIDANTNVQKVDREAGTTVVANGGSR